MEGAELDDTLGALTVRYRRWLRYLLMDWRASTVDELAPALSTLDETASDGVTETEVAIRLCQIDLPNLVDAGFVEYDRRNGDVVLLEDSEELRDLLGIVREWEEPAVRTELS